MDSVLGYVSQRLSDTLIISHRDYQHTTIAVVVSRGNMLRMHPYDLRKLSQIRIHTVRDSAHGNLRTVWS